MSLPSLDPDAAAIATAVADQPPTSMRARGLLAAREAVDAASRSAELAEMASVEDRVAPGPGGEIPLRIHRPIAEDHAPALVYFHGGGMCLGSNESFEPLARNLAAASGAAVVAVEYRLAPETPPPAQFDDSWAATAWVAEHAAGLGFDPGRIGVIGDSAGGTLAAAVALAARDRGGPALECQVLLYPGVDRDMAARSLSECAEAPLLGRDDVRYLNELADAGQGPPESPYRVPAYADDLTGLPPAIVATAECDPIRDWGERYARRLRDAGVQTTMTRYPGLYHGFAMQPEHLARGRLALAEIGALLRAKFANPLPF